MAKELYFDISSENTGGSLYRINVGPSGRAAGGSGPETNGEIAFLYNYSVADAKTGEVTVFDTWYVSFEAFWKVLTKDAQWYYLHPLFVHPEQREFVREALKRVNWAIYPDKKWQESHQRQWKKVLSDPTTYYGV